MSGAKEIRTQIRSVRNTQKITKAMEMVAASKMRKAQDQMQASRPYAERIGRVIGHIAHADPDYQHPFLEQRETVRRVGYVIVSSDRGLCGGLNINLFKAVVTELQTFREQGVEVDLCLFGNKAVSFFKRYGFNVVAQATALGDAPRVEDLVGSVKVMLDRFEQGQVDRVYLANNEFVNTMAQRPELRQLLPVRPLKEEVMRDNWDYIYEPSAGALLGHILMRHVEAQVYQGVVENTACEMAARMVAMKAATDNAGEIIDALQLAYNKARQAAITQELAEIVAGAAAVS